MTQGDDTTPAATTTTDEAPTNPPAQPPPTPTTRLSSLTSRFASTTATTDDPSQLTEDEEGSYSMASSSHRSTRSQFSYENFKHVVHQASEILQGRLPSTDPVMMMMMNNETIIEMPSSSSHHHHDDNDDADEIFHDTTDRVAAATTGQQRQQQAIDFLHDAPRQMTWSRRIGLYGATKPWYNPSLKLAQRVQLEESERLQQRQQQSDEAVLDGDTTKIKPRARDAYPFTVSKREQPSLAKAWAYFEHVALPRYIVRPKANNNDKRKNCCVRAVRRVFCKGSQTLERAEPGERDLPTKLYSPVFTPHTQLGDWGLGVGLYFSTLRAITILTFVAGLLNIPNLMYFVGPDYTDDEQVSIDNWLTKGSAICTDAVWVPCPACPEEEYAEERFLFNVTHSETGEMMNFTLKNNCNGATLEQGFINYATLFLVIVGIFAFSIYLKHMEVKFDEDEQTAQDYSIVIENPPTDATNPEEWKKFFFDNFDGAHVTAITIAVDNDLLVRSLVRRREVLREIEMKVDPGTHMDTLTLAGIAAHEERSRRFLGRLMAMFVKGVPELFAELMVLTSKVQGLSQLDYPASNVFVVFETEAGQRRVLEALSLGSLQVSRNSTAAVKNPAHLFRGKHVLKVSEPDEPSTIRWADLNEKFKEQLKQQLLTTTCTFASIVAIAFIVRVCNDASAAWSAIAISVFNSIFPMFAKFLCSFEAHASEGGKQRSLYFKIALFRWVNTAIVITIITPFTSTLSTANDNGLITKIYAIFFAEIVTTNAIQLTDPVGHLKRHYLAPRAHTQDAMNLNFSGEEFELAERYTNMTKIFFLAVWYCALYPGTMFLCSFTLLVNYFTDRFSLMRTWKRQPLLGPKISQFSRKYFFTLAILAMAVMSSYYWSGFPFDNMCSLGTAVPGQWVGNWTHDKLDEPVVVNAEDMTYKHCQQDFFRFNGEPAFPFISSKQLEGSEWMTEDQELLSDIFGWTVVGVMSYTILGFIWGWWSSFTKLFYGSYKSRGEDMKINFSDVDSASVYVPQVASPVYAYPLLACNIDGIDPELLDWTDPDRPYSFYDLTKDAEVLLKGMDVSNNVTFSQVVHWPPAKKAENQENGLS